mmetsp:Transcript_3107/g.8911  ORF Transcript_3107/g.8911 Transcript_3107/m.8911 type:complete len:239 (-) Transcript_3107:3537-4253(-)
MASRRCCFSSSTRRFASWIDASNSSSTVTIAPSEVAGRDLFSSSMAFSASKSEMPSCWALNATASMPAASADATRVNRSISSCAAFFSSINTWASAWALFSRHASTSNLRFRSPERSSSSFARSISRWRSLSAWRTSARSLAWRARYSWCCQAFSSLSSSMAAADFGFRDSDLRGTHLATGVFIRCFSSSGSTSYILSPVSWSLRTLITLACSGLTRPGNRNTTSSSRWKGSRTRSID